MLYIYMLPTQLVAGLSLHCGIVRTWVSRVPFLRPPGRVWALCCENQLDRPCWHCWFLFDSIYYHNVVRSAGTNTSLGWLVALT